MDEKLKGYLVAALAPLRERVRTDTCWIKRPGRNPSRIDEPLDDEHLRRHVNGGPVYGAVPMTPGTSVTMVAVMDLDSHKGETAWASMVETARRLIAAAAEHGCVAIPFRSSGGHGIHLYFTWDAPQDARSVRATLRASLAACGFRDGAGGVAKGQVEIFPKQDAVETDKFGSMFVLPGGGKSVPLIGADLALGEKEDMVGMDWPASAPVTVLAPAPPVERRQLTIDDPGLRRLASALEALPNDDLEYEAWRDVILSVHAATDGSEEGRELARAWSAKSGKHTDEFFDRNVWNWAGGDKARMISGQHVIALARRAGWVDPALLEAFAEMRAEDLAQRARERAELIGAHGTEVPPPSPFTQQFTLEDMLEQFVFLKDGSRVAPRDAPQLALSFADASRSLEASVDLIPGANGRMRTVRRIDKWLAHPRRLTIHTQTFAPGQGEFCWSPEGQEAQNLWLPRERRIFSPPAPADWRERAQPFFDHIDYLVPNPHERERFINWLAHIEQKPGELPQTHYLLVARQTGIGRNWVSYVLARVWAGYVALGFDLADALRNGFNGALSRRVLACVDELHEAGHGHEGGRAGEKLKSMLTERTRLINPKYGRQHVEFNCCRFLMFSNHDAALPLAESDRRVIVIENPSERRSESYYNRIYGMVDDPMFTGAVIKALQERDISGFRPGEVAPMNAAKLAVVNAGRSDIAQALADVAAAWPSACITAADLKAEIADICNTSADKVGRLAGAAQTVGLRAYPVVVKVDGAPTRVWLLRDAARWSSAPAKEVAEEVLRGRAAPAEGTSYVGEA